MMQVLRAVPLVLGALLTGGCLDVANPNLCTAEVLYGLTIAVRDSVTGLPAAAEAIAVARDGGHQEILSGLFGNDLHLVGAPERPGIYDITITKPGYQDWVRGGVNVEAGSCHVVPVIIEAKLQPVTQ
jgi:hypothetical protein